ncbi:tetratricopeptide repeat protein [Longispora albida]|uniref:tetratricopeptide repeat protein n=1 Tax=Longispora albida TaxID=203523 RepID=UPI000375944B|nr:tetratricopeptide repeat protein [Longispora albida]
MHAAPAAEWEQRIADAWASADEYEGKEEEFRELIASVCAELPPGHPVSAFERGGSFDSTGHPAEAVVLYREALAGGLDGYRRREVIVQLSSSVRNLGDPAEAIELLTAERERASDGYDDALAATLALALSSAGRDREALSIALEQLAGHMTRYRRSMTNYARALRD